MIERLKKILASRLFGVLTMLPTPEMSSTNDSRITLLLVNV
jgi:hypothetical protein